MGDALAGKRKDMVKSALTGPLELFQDRALPFDTAAARHHVDPAVMVRNSGPVCPTPDGCIAAIVASRDNSPHEAAGVTAANPWQSTKLTRPQWRSHRPDEP